MTHCLRKSKNSNQPTVPHTANGPISQYAGKSLNLAGTSGNSLFTGFGDPDKPEKGDAKDAMKPEKDMNEIIEWAKILLKFKMKRSDVISTILSYDQSLRAKTVEICVDKGNLLLSFQKRYHFKNVFCISYHNHCQRIT